MAKVRKNVFFRDFSTPQAIVLAALIVLVLGAHFDVSRQTVSAEEPALHKAVFGIQNLFDCDKDAGTEV